MNKVTGILMLLIYVCVATTLLNGAFVQEDNLRNLLRWSSMFGVIGIGAALVIITGGIDLSIGSVIGLLGCMLPMLLVGRGWSVGASLGAVMLGAALIGLTHGLLITKMKLQPFIVTLCGLLIYRGLARYIPGDQTQGFGTSFDGSLRLLATGAPCSAAFLVMVAGIGVTGYFLIQAAAGGGGAAPGRRALANFLGALCGIALAVTGSSRFWYGFELHAGEKIDLFLGWQMPTWRATVPEQAVQLPGELIWWFGLSAIPFMCWFVWVAWRSDRRILRLLPLQILMIGLCLPFALAGSREMVSLAWEGDAESVFGEKMWQVIHRIEVFVALGVIMATLAWLFRRGVKAGGEAARLPAMATGIAAIMWLLGRSQVAREALWQSGTPDTLLGLAGSTQLLEVLVPAPFFVLVVIALMASAFLNLTIYGRYLLALGRNEQAARFSGVRTDRMVITAYVLCSMIAGVGAILFTLDWNAVQPPGHGAMYELYAIAAAVLGGCSLRGGEGSILGVVIGAAVIRVLYNSTNLLGISSLLEYTNIGLVILLGAIADEIVRRLAARRRAAEQAAAAASKDRRGGG